MPRFLKFLTIVLAVLLAASVVAAEALLRSIAMPHYRTCDGGGALVDVRGFEDDGSVEEANGCVTKRAFTPSVTVSERVLAFHVPLDAAKAFGAAQGASRPAKPSRLLSGRTWAGGRLAMEAVRHEREDVPRLERLLDLFAPSQHVSPWAYGAADEEMDVIDLPRPRIIVDGDSSRVEIDLDDVELDELTRIRLGTVQTVPTTGTAPAAAPVAPG